MNWYLQVLKKYAQFSGRARRQEFWMFFLFNWIFIIVAIILDNLAGTTFDDLTPYGLFYLLYVIPIIIPGLAVTVRRLHDVGKSGWFYFIILIPLVGAIWLLILFCTEGVAGLNEYGENPKGITVS
jgi:uncharacterized membrane protein YhaH (DUF805 family)